MKRYFFRICCVLFCLPLWAKAQVVNEAVDSVSVAVPVAPEDDSLSVNLALPAPQPLFSLAAPGFDGCSPWWMGTYGPSWDLHEGLNAQLGMSLSAAWGKNAPSGVGFGQNLALAYAMPLNQRFSVAAGLYAQNMDWGAYHQTDLGISAVLGFKVNDFFTLYGYGTKSLIPRSKQMPVGGFPLFIDNFRDRIGAMAEFKIGENAKIQISVERANTNYGDSPYEPVLHRVNPR